MKNSYFKMDPISESTRFVSQEATVYNREKLQNHNLTFNGFVIRLLRQKWCTNPRRKIDVPDSIKFHRRFSIQQTKKENNSHRDCMESKMQKSLLPTSHNRVTKKRGYVHLYFVERTSIC